MNFYFDESGNPIGYHVEKHGNWTIKGDYLEIGTNGRDAPSNLYKITNNKVKFPYEYREVEGIIDTDALTFTVGDVEHKLIKPSGHFEIPVRFPI